ncbi:unnamed protein product [Didymodactylos carnosus]|uniref:Uncharacterized protein n=1 Tax=Didymodactylos carnosus TaxID=1234261 RepID=A0A815GXY7_9BILA|nr:unnamed protein product [Didymodactylos carnosus]CAF1344205.1 unnamed protein product [Didymodactylos carnosus]CAF3956194.1 unnamed protein product [Didymodactylos carnosus]CAF4208243.1 unnamed protein product [Didymodactylos carnosus]
MVDCIYYLLFPDSRKISYYQLIIQDIFRQLLHVNALSTLYQQTLFEYLKLFNNRNLSDNDKTDVNPNRIRTDSNKPSSSTTQNSELTATISTTMLSRSSFQSRSDEASSIQHTRDNGGNNNTVSLVWLVNDMEMSQVGNRIQDKFNERSMFFDDKNNCFEYIQSNTNTAIFLITCGEHARDLIVGVHDLSQIHSLYIYCDNNAVQSFKLWSEPYSKVEGAFSVEERLLYKLALDLALCYTKKAADYKQSGDNDLANINYCRSQNIYENMLKHLNR